MTDQQTLQTICNAIPEKNILIIGDVILDRFVYGSVDRISPESPVPVLARKREQQMLGGAGNSFANLIGLQTNATLLSVIGDDDEGQNVKDLLTALGSSDQFIVQDKTRPTSVKTRFLAGHQQLLRTDFEKTDPVSDEIADQIFTHFQTLLPAHQAIILSDYGKGVLRADLITKIIDMANEANVPVIVDPKGQDFSIYRGAFTITPNRKELSDATQGRPTNTDEEVITAARYLIDTCGLQSVVATRSQDGISVIPSQSAPVTHVRSSQGIEVFDVSGAGDTVIATIAATIAANGSLSDAAHLANIAGSIAVTKVGTTPIRLEEIAQALTNESSSTTERMRHAPLLSEEKALEEVNRWRARGLKVGFTNGCFDILHAGHVTYLDEARNRCDRLVLALNSDSSVKVLKGPTRPIHDEQARATVLGALAAVDMVVLFGAEKHGDDNTACALLDYLKPDMYFKGGDYTVDQIPEAPTVQAYGGSVEVLQIVEGYSTTKAIEKSKTA
ncbi:MAG: D-glycero-beta-D-manno-heptose-7-phosphate kinase [Alphaproteobacteria bacterium]|nr:D-glycero-beta-D-manno-heptose-7-phosphate kinase [Alphaproteobacteria bacterium]HCQ71400.1 D-glycero-beta-D-manno-heptose-7-phosphate kinase [Rhodospirillaceae bacterium]|tara:strand:- start:37114 stop:38619 length:1506 start_codon:yes stop_codon:yes gene_type:complete